MAPPCGCVASPNHTHTSCLEAHEAEHPHAGEEPHEGFWSLAHQADSEACWLRHKALAPHWDVSLRLAEEKHHLQDRQTESSPADSTKHRTAFYAHFQAQLHHWGHFLSASCSRVQNKEWWVVEAWSLLSVIFQSLLEESMGPIREHWLVLEKAAQTAEILAGMDAEEYLLFQQSVSP